MAKMLRSVISLTFILYAVANEIPSPPEILDTDCKRVTAILSWSPTGEAPVTGYIVQYKTNWSQDKWINYEFVQLLQERHVRLMLSPWANYTFQVMSKNNAGLSAPSGVSDVCETEEDVPYKNPDMVYGRGNGPNNLVISWKPMPPIDQNAPGFYYKVYWRRDDNSEPWNQKIILEWEQHRLVIENLPKLVPYRIKVEAYNSMGKANVEAKEVVGYSDEDKPTEAPKRFRSLKIIDGKSAQLSWEPVSPFSINGHFKGYKVQLWTENDENKTEMIIPANVTTALIDIFTPGKINNAQILAFNGAFDGPPSDPIELIMPEDVYPDPPAFIWTRVTDQNNKAVIRITSQPNITNRNPGKQIYIQYRKKDLNILDQWDQTLPENTEDAKQPVDLVNLEFDTFYEVKVIARSGKLEVSSSIHIIDTRVEKWPKITTTTTTTIAPETTPRVSIPSEEFHVEPDVEQYPESRVVEPDVKKEENVNPMSPENTENDDEGNNFANTPWFIALLCVLAFICAFVGVFIFIKYRRNEYEVKGSGRAATDNVRIEPKNTNNSEPHEYNSFIVPVEANVRNGNVGHDEGDSHDDEDYEERADRGRPYQPTTKSLNHT